MKEKIKWLFDNTTTRGKILRFCLSIIVIGLVVLLAYLILRWTGAWEKVNSMEKIRALVESGGVFSSLIFLIFQILQTTVLQIPAIFVTIAGALIFGPWEAFFISYLGVMIGSIIMFIVGRKAGRPFLYWLVGKETGENWIKKLSNGKYLFFLMMIFPMFPDDILCVVAGITKMSFPFFFWTNLIARGLGIACTVFFGSGAIIPFHGWGIIVWGIIILFIAVLFYLSVRYKDKLDDIFMRLFTKSKKEDSVNTSSQGEKTTAVIASENETNPDGKLNEEEKKVNAGIDDDKDKTIVKKKDKKVSKNTTKDNANNINKEEINTTKIEKIDENSNPKKEINNPENNQIDPKSTTTKLNKLNRKKNKKI